MKAIVTGGAGFIGSHLTDALIERGMEVSVIDNVSTGQKNNVHEASKLYCLDVQSNEARAVVLEEQPDFVFHLAAQADVTKSIADPLFDAETNINGTINMLEAARIAGVKRFVFASTSAVYGNLAKQVITEADPAHPISFYGASKLTAERYIAIYHHLYGLPYTILRYGNVYGPRQLPKGEGGVVAVFCEKLKAGESIAIHGDGIQSRDFVFVNDVVKANLAAAEPKPSGIYHVSTAASTSINTLADAFKTLVPSLKTYQKPSRNGDITHSCLANQKAKDILGWEPVVSITDGISQTWRSN